VSELPTVGKDKGLDLSPKGLRQHVLLVAEFAAQLRERLGFVEAAEVAKRATELGCV
jgi:hypothetical protein